MVMLPTLLIIGVPAKLVLWGERLGIECLMSQSDSLARDNRTRQVAAIFRTSKRNLRGSLFMCDVSNASCSYLRFTFSKGSEWYRSSNGKGREKVLDVTEIKTNAQ